MFEKNKEANQLAEISKALAAEAARNDEKVVNDRQDYGHRVSRTAAAQLHAAPSSLEKKKAKKKGTHDRLETSSQREASISRTAEDLEQNDDVMKIVAAQKDALQTESPTVGSTFAAWYLSKVAECFGDEIDRLKDADAPVHPKVLMKAMASWVPLFSQEEQTAVTDDKSTSWIEDDHEVEGS